jgi:nucleoside phosphorylase
VSATVVVTAFRLETRAVLAALHDARRVRPATRPCWVARAGAREVLVVEGGVGPAAARGAATAIPPNAHLLGSGGFAGALAPGLLPGDVIVPSAIVWEDNGVGQRYEVPAALVEAVVRALVPVLPRPPQTGLVLSSPVVVAGVAAKRVAFDRHGALAVEMEAATLLSHARTCGVPFFALRVVLDPADLSLEELPPNLDASWVARVRLATMPTLWPLLATLRRHAATAGAELTRSLRAVLPDLAGS